MTWEWKLLKTKGEQNTVNCNCKPICVSKKKNRITLLAVIGWNFRSQKRTEDRKNDFFLNSDRKSKENFIQTCSLYFSSFHSRSVRFVHGQNIGAVTNCIRPGGRARIATNVKLSSTVTRNDRRFWSRTRARGNFWSTRANGLNALFRSFVFCIISETPVSPGPIADRHYRYEWNVLTTICVLIDRWQRTLHGVATAVRVLTAYVRYTAR